jgi:hypothetical protein
MLPAPQAKGPQVVHTFEVLTPAGHIHKFPCPNLLQRLLELLFVHAETAIISSVVFGLICSAGLLVETVSSLQFENCKN